MGFPELLFIIGLVLTFMGIAVFFIAIARWALSIPPGHDRSVGVVFLGPIPVVFAGRNAKLALALTAIVIFAFLAIFLMAVLGVLWP